MKPVKYVYGDFINKIYSHYILIGYMKSLFAKPDNSVLKKIQQSCFLLCYHVLLCFIELTSIC